MGDDWARPVVHFEIVARDPQRQAAFYRGLCHWEIGDGPIMVIPPGLGGPEPGPGGHIRQGADLRTSLDLAVELGGRIVAEPFDVPGGPTLAAIDDPEGNPLVLVQQ
jgi:predicted enzyme related to lactoylglutathione lyase